MDPRLPYGLAVCGLFLYILAIRGIVNRRVMGTYGSEDSQDLRYYIRIGAYFLGAILFILIAGFQFKQLYKWTGLLLYVLSWGLIGFITFGAKRSFQRIWSGWSLPGFRIFSRKKSIEAPVNNVFTWPLAALAIFSRLRGWAYQQLDTRGPSKRSRKFAQRYLKREWDIKNESDFDEVQEWLFETGHRKEFYALVEKVEKMTVEGAAQYLADLHAQDTPDTENEEWSHRFQMIKEQSERLKSHGFMAWDIIRYMDNTRLGFLAGYMDEEGAADALYPAAQILQSRFGSWEELAESYMTGREFWSIITIRESGSVYRNAIVRLLHDEESPWNQVPFDMALYGMT